MADVHVPNLCHCWEGRKWFVLGKLGECATERTSRYEFWTVNIFNTISVDPRNFGDNADVFVDNAKWHAMPCMIVVYEFRWNLPLQPNKGTALELSFVSDYRASTGTRE